MKKPKYTFEIYKDKKGEFRYRVIHKNGNELFKSSEGYKSKATMMRVWDNFFALYYHNNIVVDLTLKKK